MDNRIPIRAVTKNRVLKKGLKKTKHHTRTGGKFLLWSNKKAQATGKRYCDLSDADRQIWKDEFNSLPDEEQERAYNDAGISKIARGI